jgi:VanZ family protein
MNTDRSLAAAALHPLRGRMILVVWMLSILSVGYLSLIPLPRLPVDVPNSDKILHFFAYAWLAFLPMLRERSDRTGVVLAISMFFLGIALEIAQLHVPGRSCSLWDAMANGAGVLSGMVGSRLLLKGRKKK